jgi:DNA-binding response OmpR family regulator
MSLTILYIEDNQVVADAVSDLLAEEGWRVEVCADGIAGLREIEGERHYDLLVVDHDLPYIHGLLLVERARRLQHRLRVPIIMVSADEHQAAARNTGANLFLRKPEGIGELVESVKRLIDESRAS